MAKDEKQQDDQPEDEKGKGTVAERLAELERKLEIFEALFPPERVKKIDKAIKFLGV
jgi:hypothetical protein